MLGKLALHEQEAVALKEQRGQTSIELVILMGVVILIAFSLFPTILREMEMSRALAAARDGAAFAISMRGMGYDSPSGNVKGIPPGTIKIKEMQLESTTISCPAEKQKYRIRFYVYAPSYITNNADYESSIRTTIQNYAIAYINQVFSGKLETGTRAETDRFCFSVGATFIEY